MKKLIFILSAIVFGISLNSCDDNSDSGGTYTYRVRMTDAPGPYDKVNIDLQSVIVTDSNGQSVTLNTATGIYNLLDYSNGLNVLIANSSLTSSNVQSVRLVLGTNNTVVHDGTTYALATLNNEQGGLTINVNQDLEADTTNELLLDFDAYTSVVATTSSSYRLRPVIRAVYSEASGEIKGSLAANAVIGNLAMVTATSASNVQYSSSVDKNTGQFQISGLPAGTYTVTVTPRLPLLPSIHTNVVVEAGASTNIGTVDFE